MQYSTIELHSGMAISLRPRTYDEWLHDEQERLALLEQASALIKKQNVSEAEMLVQRAVIERRTARLTVCVKDFSANSTELSLADIATIEHKLDALEKPEIIEKN